MTHVGDALSLHEAVVQHAKGLFAGFRDDRELVQQFKGVVAACLCEAYHKLCADGRQILKRQFTSDLDGPEKETTARAHWRNDMHKSTAASADRTSVFVPKSALDLVKSEKADGDDALVLADKPAARWNLNDCRSWLLEASKSIARAMHEKEETGGMSISEFEGRLVEHALTLCDYLEKELSRNSFQRKRRVVTPRVKNMASLSIKWQHEDTQRPTGFMTNNRSGPKTVALPNGGKTSGQYLILLTPMKLAKILKDKLAGDAFSKELRALLAVQETKKRKKRSEEGGMRRFKQMKRKPWITG